MTLIEKVAKAIFEHGYVGDWPPKHEVDLNMDANYFRSVARVAIEAMREPTDAMHDAGWNSGQPNRPPKYMWHDMIDAALNEHQK